MGILKLKINNKEIYVEKGTILYQIIKDNNLEENIPIVLANVNGTYHELASELQEEGVFTAVDITNNLGSRTYVRTLQFVLIKAVFDIFPEAKVTIEHSLGKGLFGEIHKNIPLDEKDIERIKTRMKELIDKDIPIKKVCMNREEAIKIFAKYNMDDKVRLLRHVTSNIVRLYELDGRYDYFYGSMAYSTGALKIFDLFYRDPGFVLKYPLESDPFNIPEFVEHKKLGKIFFETEQWGNILGVGDVGSLNDKVENGEIIDIIRVAEALHEKKIAYIADMISERKDTKIVLIAGPSSSGKTTFARRLGIQLRVNGLVPIPISLDDYFVDRDHTPKDENGEYDFESIYALDLELFNKNLESMLKGEAVETPTFNFKTGSREWNGQKINIPANGILIVEGIHGLNEMLTASIPMENKFKIYISALTQLNVDNHNRIATTDVRIIRRIVRDYLSRGYGGEDTLKMWPSIKRGEEKNIFTFQENADIMFNSTLVYELCVLKKYALKELEKISEKSPVYYEALRLKSFLHFFKDVDMSLVPDNSILREFIGGSCFYKY
ncbi:nucleoside kinase [Clostridiaceae bacterium UIB06]|uniref:Nucleoside kinase n=1 Tax=Clostridium thailandense TaxID=2794346 RepID=A0A949TUK2_9CLOT|nr:nucleoside kinase [Clostridium thailandense]MBV7272161.1 nucleoside kinase [Clostridium thailandense]MCH5135987.1 nucleoside kinase [Clostridiaceae bacterium UIB06]